MSHPTAEPRCTNCHTLLTGRFCASCGQSAADHLGSVRAFAGHVAESTWSLDSRGVRTFRTLLARPGVLTREYLEGARARYMPPIQVYGIAAAALFLVAVFRPLVTFDPRTRWFRSGLGRTIGFSNLLSDEDVADLTQRGISLDLFGERFLSTATGHLSTFLILSVPIFAVIVALVFVRSRRPLPHHAIFALHWSAFYLLVLAVGQMLPAVGGLRGVADLALLVVALTYLVVSLRRVYALGWAGAVLRTLVLFAAYQVILLVWLETVVLYAKRSV